MNKVGILYHPMKEAAIPLAERLEKFLKDKSISTWVCSAWEVEEARALVNGTDIVLSIGGDGTILRAAQAIVPEPTPITGINLGNLGFLTELSVEEAEDKLELLLAGEGWIDERYLLQAELSFGNDEQKQPQKFYALNDVVVARGEVARVVYVEAIVNGESLTTYKADGIIVATATGSTGYALAAGGPILHPQVEELLLAPITPHLSSTYSLVIPSSAEVKLCLHRSHTANLSVDGHINLPVSEGAVVTVKHSQRTVRFLRIHPRDAFYGSLEQRLKGKQ
ncbi:NAD(+)/NADH kinase [Chloroflexota bacterium]